MARSEWEAISQGSANKAADARKLLRLKEKEEDELRATAKATPLLIMAYEAPVSPTDDGFSALDEELWEAPPGLPLKVCRYIRKLLTLANDHEISK